jgi:hypothetical protein
MLRLKIGYILGQVKNHTKAHLVCDTKLHFKKDTEMHSMPN